MKEKIFHFLRNWENYVLDYISWILSSPLIYKNKTAVIFFKSFQLTLASIDHENKFLITLLIILHSNNISLGGQNPFVSSYSVKLIW